MNYLKLLTMFSWCGLAFLIYKRYDIFLSSTLLIVFVAIELLVLQMNTLKRMNDIQMDLFKSYIFHKESMQLDENEDEK